MVNNKLRRTRFENVAGRRTQKILEFLDSLSNCSNKNNYDYTEEDIKKMFAAIRERLKTTEAAFSNAINRSEKNKFKF